MRELLNVTHAAMVELLGAEKVAEILEPPTDERRTDLVQSQQRQAMAVLDHLAMLDQ